MLMSQKIGSWLLHGIEGVRQPTILSDFDYICKAGEFNHRLKSYYEGYEVIAGSHPIRKSYILKKPNFPIIEVEIAYEGSVAYKLLEILSEHTISNLDLSYTLKMSHRYLRNSPHFLKTMTDIHVMRKAGAVIPIELIDWLKLREDETYYYKHPNLNQDKGNFFDTPNVTYVYDHDSIHKVVAIGEVPAYTKFLVGEVRTSKKKFDKLPLTDKLNAVLEEAMVLAVERSLIYEHRKGVVTLDKEYSVWEYSLQKVCTSITSGWFREFAWEHYQMCIKLYHSRCAGFFQRFLDGVDQGLVPFHKEK
jgi:hypothetical protein